MGACARNMYSDSAEIKPAQCCIKLVFHLTYKSYFKTRETAVAQWLRCCATNRKAASSIPDGVLGTFH